MPPDLLHPTCTSYNLHPIYTPYILSVPTTAYFYLRHTSSYLYLLIPTCTYYILYALLTTYILSIPATSYNNLPTQLSLNMFTIKEVSEQHLVSDQGLEYKTRINLFYYPKFTNHACFVKKQH